MDLRRLHHQANVVNYAWNHECRLVLQRDEQSEKTDELDESCNELERRHIRTDKIIPGEFDW